MRTLLAAAFVVFVLTAPRSIGAAQTPTTPAPAANAPDIENGRKVFAFGNTSCSNCHGNGAVGGFGPDLAGMGLSLARAAQAIRRPIWLMPAFDNVQVTDKEIADMVAYWNSLPKVDKIGNWRFPFPKDAPPGQQLAVHQGCTQCHGSTFDTPRHGQGEVDGDFEWFKRMVYEHTKAQPEQWALLDREAAPSSTPPPGRLRMGNYDRRRLPEETLKEIYNWAFLDLGKLVPISARLTVGPADSAGTAYLIDVANGGVPNRGLTAEDVTISLIVPAGQRVVSGSGNGYQGVRKQGSDEVASWKVAKFAPRDRQKFSIVLSGAAAPNAAPRGIVSWTKPTAKASADVHFTLPRPGGRGAGD